jgi:hypothetical protein
MNTLKFGNGEWYGKEGTILAYNDENNNYKPLPFTFDRDSVATRVNKQGLIETVGADQPRIDYSNDSNGALLLEPSRTNLIQYSNFSSGWDLLSGGSIAYNQTVSPDGTQNASVLSGNGVNGNAVYDALNLSVQSYTLSVFAKQKGVSIISFEGFTSGALGLSKFNLSNGTIETASSNQFSDEKIEDYGNGWYRCSVKLTPTSSGIKFFGFKGEDSDSGELFSLYGAQLEVGSYATSIINTKGSAVTRLADSCSQTVPDGVIGQTEGTILVDFNFDGDISGNRSVAILSSGGSADFIASFIFNNLFYARIRANNGSLVDVTKSNLTSGNHKIAIAYASNDLTFYLDGNIVGQNTSASVSFGSELSTIKIGESTSGTAELGGLVSKTSLYNTRLSNSELAALTQV